jgi:hypothetical protein
VLGIERGLLELVGSHLAQPLEAHDVGLEDPGNTLI